MIFKVIWKQADEFTAIQSTLHKRNFMNGKKALYIGGCAAPYHRLEPTIEPISCALQKLGLTIEVTGIYHPEDSVAPLGDYSALNAQKLAAFDALVLFTTGQDSGENVDAVLQWVRGGGALVGIHCAADSFKNRLDYIAVVGGAFRHHPAPLDIAVEFTDRQHPITRDLEPFTVHDELYLFDHYDSSRVHLLAQTQSYDDNGPVPLCWVREEGEGRVFYLSLGHFPEVMKDANWQTLFARGVRWALKD
jgi:type 1 glutamine amidotransferase